MTEVERIQKYFNKVDRLSDVCRSISSWAHGDYPELEIGKTYKVSHIGVLRSSTNIMLTDFPSKEYNASCFYILENGMMRISLQWYRHSGELVLRGVGAWYRI